MYKIILVLLLISNFSFGQKEISYTSIDSASYADYMKNDFKKIRKTEKEANKENIDFYYLRMRVGILSYGQGKYEYALKQFIKANEMNPADTTAQEYLYYTYLFSGRVDEADVLANSLSASFQKKVGYKIKKIENFSIGFADFSNSNISDNVSRDYLATDFKRADATINGTTLGLNFSIENRINARTTTFHKVSLFQTNSMGVEQFAIIPTQNSMIQIPASKKERDYTDHQYQYNFGFSRYTKMKYQITAGFGFYRTNTSDLLAKPPMNSMGSTSLVVNYEDLKSQYNDISVSLMLSKRFRYVAPSISTSFSNLYNTNQFQTEGSLTYYPLGNPKLYGITSFAYINNDGNNQTVFSQKVGFKVTKWLWMDGIYSLGNHSNYISNVGFLIFNTADPVLSNVNVNLHLYNKKVELVLGVSSQNRQASFNQYTSTTEYTPYKYSYTNTNFLTTFKWNF